MYAVEFEAKIKNGGVNIPKEYSYIYQSKAKVLINLCQKVFVIRFIRTIYETFT